MNFLSIPIYIGDLHVHIADFKLFYSVSDLQFQTYQITLVSNYNRGLHRAEISWAIHSIQVCLSLCIIGKCYVFVEYVMKKGNLCMS
jgi:hypothetical protein